MRVIGLPESRVLRLMDHTDKKSQEMAYINLIDGFDFFTIFSCYCRFKWMGISRFWSIWVTYGSILSVEFVLPACHIVWQLLKCWALCAKLSTKFLCIPFMLIGTIDFYHFMILTVTLTLAGDHKVNAKQNLLASCSCSLFSWSGWNWVLCWSRSSWTVRYYFLYFSQIYFIKGRKCYFTDGQKL